MGVTGNALQAGPYSLPAGEGFPMIEACTKCGKLLETEWAFCPHCAAPCPHQARTTQPHAPEKAPVSRGFSGLLFGVLMAPPMIIGGTMLCLMVGPWMAVGIPLIIGGICAPFVGPLVGISAVRGNCPWCGTKISSVGMLDAFYCYACSKRIELRDRELVKAE